MLMDLPTIHQLTTLILEPTRTNACPFTLHTGFIAGHICVPAGGGEVSARAFVADAFGELPMLGVRKFLSTASRLAVNTPRARTAFRASRTGGSVRHPDPYFTARRLASAARLSDRHLA